MVQQPNNFFEKSRERIWNLYSLHLKGSAVGAFLVVSSCALSAKAQAALLNSSKALGYGAPNTTFFTLHPCPCADDNSSGMPLCAKADNDTSSCVKADNATPSYAKTKSDPAQTNHTSTEANAAQSSLELQDVFRVIESLDPLCIVVADAAATKEVACAFHTQLELECFTTLLGHYCCCFSDFERMLSLEKTKQQAWALLKTLKR